MISSPEQKKVTTTPSFRRAVIDGLSPQDREDYKLLEQAGIVIITEAADG